MYILTSESSKVLHHLPRIVNPKLFKKKFVCITTAAVLYNPHPWVKKEQECLSGIGASIENLDLTKVSPEELIKTLENCEGVFVHGGNTFYLLQEMQRTNFKDCISSLIKRGGVYIGSSAGTLVAGPSIEINAEKAQAINALKVNASEGLNVINFHPLVHFNNQAYWASYKEIFEKSLTENINLFPLRDDQYIIVKGETYQLITAS